MIFDTHARRIACLVAFSGLAIVLIMLPSWVPILEDRSWLVIISDSSSSSSSSSRRFTSSSRSQQKQLSRFFRTHPEGAPEIERVRNAFIEAVCPRSGGKKARDECQGNLSDDRIGTEIRIACVGDSITHGNGSHLVAEGKKPSGKKKGGGNYPMTLQAILDSFSRAQSDFMSSGGNSCRPQRKTVQVRNFGVNGATAGDSNKKFSYRTHSEFAEALAWKPHVVVLMLGSNDCKTDVWKSRGSFKRDLTWLIQSFSSVFDEVANQSPAKSNKKNRKKRRAETTVSTTTAAAAAEAADVSSSSHSVGGIAPWILLMTPPPIAVTSDTIDWNFDPKRLAKDVVPSVRAVSNGLGTVGLIDLNDVFVSSKLWSCPSSSSSSNINMNRSGEQDTTFKCLFRDGVHPKRQVHDFIAHVVAEALCS